MTAGRLAALVVAAACAASSAARADRIHLRGGGIIDADHWWVEGETLHIESAGGTIGLPRSELVRVERSEPAGAPPAPAAAASADAVSPQTMQRAERLMREGNSALAARDYDTAIARFYAVVEAVPDEPGPRVGYAVAEMALGRDAMALPVILDGLVRRPADPQLQEVLGDLRNRDERVEDALAAWKESFRVAPSDRVRAKIEKAERELAAARDYRFTAAAHFNVKYDGELDQDLVAQITDFLEDAYAELTSLYRDAPPQPITVLLYPQQAFHDVTQLGPEVAGAFDGKIRAPLAGMTRLDGRARAILKHELAHAIVQDVSRGACPRWLHEGLAQMAEPRTLRPADVARLARTVRAGDPATWPDRAFDYPAALSLARYLAARRGFDSVVAVLERLGDGATLDAAFEAVYGQDYPAIARAWAGSLPESDGP